MKEYQIGVSSYSNDCIIGPNKIAETIGREYAHIRKVSIVKRLFVYALKKALNQEGFFFISS